MWKFFIRRSIVAIVISILMAIVGALTITTLPVAQFPNIAPPKSECGHYTRVPMPGLWSEPRPTKFLLSLGFFRKNCVARYHLIKLEKALGAQVQRRSLKEHGGGGRR